MEEFATAGGVATFLVAGMIANNRINDSRASAGLEPLGPVANVQSATAYGLTALGLGLAMKPRRGAADRVGKVMFLSSFPFSVVQIIRDAQRIMNHTPILARRRSMAAPRGRTTGFMTRSAGIRRAAPMAASVSDPLPVPSRTVTQRAGGGFSPSLAQEIAYSGGIGR